MEHYLGNMDLDLPAPAEVEDPYPLSPEAVKLVRRGGADSGATELLSSMVFYACCAFIGWHLFGGA